MGLEINRIKSEGVRGYPCIKRLNQLYCPSPGRGYPSDMHKRPALTSNSKTSIFHSELFADEWDHQDESNDEDHEIHLNRTRREAEQVLRRVKRDLIDVYIDENKALIKRMFGEYSPPDHGEQDNHIKPSKVTTYDGSHVKKNRGKRSHKFNDNNKVDTCESAVEIVTPYWASNSAGKIRAIVNTQHLQQAIQQEVCQSVETKRCKNECNCEQKYKWHRLLAYDPDDDCKGIFMDWFLFPSCCVCRCNNPLTKT